jgi:flagellar biosynthesis/type III secretory pathway protein FliH
MTIRAKLIPPTLSPEHAFDRYRDLVQHGRQSAASVLVRARKRAITYSRAVRARERQRGYQDGVRQARAQFASVLARLEKCYQDALEAAKYEANSTALHVAESIIGSIVSEHLGPYREWLDEAVCILKESSRFTLLYHPRCEPLVSALASTYQGRITFLSDSSLGSSDLKLIGQSGSVEFAWREALARLKSSSNREGPCHP